MRATTYLQVARRDTRALPPIAAVVELEMYQCLLSEPSDVPTWRYCYPLWPKTGRSR